MTKKKRSREGRNQQSSGVARAATSATQNSTRADGDSNNNSSGSNPGETTAGTAPPTSNQSSGPSPNETPEDVGLLLSSVDVSNRRTPVGGQFDDDPNDPFAQIPNWYRIAGPNPFVCFARNLLCFLWVVSTGFWSMPLVVIRDLIGMATGTGTKKFWIDPIYFTRYDGKLVKIYQEAPGQLHCEFCQGPELHVVLRAMAKFEKKHAITKSRKKRAITKSRKKHKDN